MLLVETYIGVSSGKGIGLFAKENITKGTKYWVRNELFDKVFSELQLQSLKKIAADYVRKYGFLEVTQNWYLCGDNARFSNHSNIPNSQNFFDDNGLVQFHIASKDIKTGEEIFCNYTELCLTCKNGIKFIESY